MADKFGDSLKKIRTEKKISQQELADMIGMHSTHISRYERNQAAPSIEVAQKIAKSLDVSIDTLIYGNVDDKAKNNLEDNELLNIFSKVQQLDKQELIAVKLFLKAFLFQKDTQQRLAAAS